MGHLARMQQEVSDRLAKIWTDDQKTRLKKLEEGFAGGPGRFAGFGRQEVSALVALVPAADQGEIAAAEAGPGRGPGGPGGRGGIVRSSRYAVDFAGLVGRDL